MDWKEFYKKVDELMSPSKNRDIILSVIMKYHVNSRKALMQRLIPFTIGIGNFRDYSTNQIETARKKFQEECYSIDEKSAGFNVVINFTKKRIFNTGDVITATASSDTKKRNLKFRWRFYNTEGETPSLEAEGEKFICPITTKTTRGYYVLSVDLVDKEYQVYGSKNIKNILID
ncbi:hypothetical protein J4476_01975 [Candidatus Woesearchaeota archaeon]|nr:hypothetical protein [Candidatus Woesearchaeota archaeon]